MKLTEEDIKYIMYGSVRELMQNSKYFYKGYMPHWTAEGHRVLSEVMDLYGTKIIEAIRNDDEQRSKDIMLRELTKQP